MANFGGSEATQPKDGVDPLWDVINFVQVLPYPKMREEYGIFID